MDLQELASILAAQISAWRTATINALANERNARRRLVTSTFPVSLVMESSGLDGTTPDMMSEAAQARRSKAEGYIVKDELLNG